MLLVHSNRDRFDLRHRGLLYVILSHRDRSPFCAFAIFRTILILFEPAYGLQDTHNRVDFTNSMLLLACHMPN